MPKKNKKGGYYNVALCKSLRKKAANSFFAKGVKDTDNILFLESGELNTYKVLKKAGGNPKRMVVPNPIEEDYKKIAKKIKRSYKMRLSELLERMSKLKRPPKFHRIWYDGMSAFDQEMRNDIKSIFKQGLLYDNSLFGLTARALLEHNKPNTSGYSSVTMIQAISYIQKTALKYGYITTLVNEGGMYKNSNSNMWVVWLEVRKK